MKKIISLILMLVLSGSIVQAGFFDTITGMLTVDPEETPSPIISPNLEEQITCKFVGSTSAQTCYASNLGQCTGTDSCTMAINGVSGSKVDIKACGGYAYATIDGADESVEFKCEQTTVTPVPNPSTPAVTPAPSIPTTTPVPNPGTPAVAPAPSIPTATPVPNPGTPAIGIPTTTPVPNPSTPFKTPIENLKEQVKCLFTNSNGMQKCYTDDGKFGCSGTGTCVADVSGEKGSKQTWKSSCGGYAYTQIDGNNDYAEFKCVSETPLESITVKEQVKCLFINSNGMQKCYTDDGKFGCSGEGTCTADISGEKGTKQIWKSSCSEYAYASGEACVGEHDACQGGYSYTIIDGNNDYAEFKCVSETPLESVTVKEQVKCIFTNSNGMQKCYTDDGKFGCSGEGTCTADVSGEKGAKQIWKSSCGGYAYTILDGNDDYAEVKCVSETEVTPEMISGKGFRYAYWQCYNKEEQKREDITSCKSSEMWQKYAKEFCNNKCYEDGSKCGVNSFSVSEECYQDAKEEKMFVPSVEEQKKEAIAEKKEEILICKDSCPLNGKCYPFGYRKSEMFCSEEGSFVEQLKSENSCDNNFECSSNVCVNGKCISSGLMEKIINWFTNLFG